MEDGGGDGFGDGSGEMAEAREEALAAAARLAERTERGWWRRGRRGEWRTGEGDGGDGSVGWATAVKRSGFAIGFRSISVTLRRLVNLCQNLVNPKLRNFSGFWGLVWDLATCPWHVNLL